MSYNVIKSEDLTFPKIKEKINKAGNLFYQYRACRIDAATIYDIENIRHGVVYARTPLQMNDPFDSMVGFSSEKIYDECITIVQGNPGEGKTFFAMQLAAACTNQKFLPDMESFEPVNMIFQTAEDGLGDTVKPRLLSSGADLQRVLVIDDTENPLTLADDRIEKAIRENNARLMVIDPLQAFLGANVDMNRANEVRPVFRKLADIAQSTGCAIVLIGHLNKASGTQSTYRGLGSIDIAAVVRSILFVGKVKDDPTTRVIVHEKSSLAPPGQALAFSLGDQKGFRWIGAYDISAEDLLAGGEGTKAELKQEQAVKLIYELLSDGREASVAEINKEAIERGISERTVRMVRNSMKEKLESERRGKDWWIWLKRQDETANRI